MSVAEQTIAEKYNLIPTFTRDKIDSSDVETVEWSAAFPVLEHLTTQLEAAQAATVGALNVSLTSNGLLAALGEMRGILYRAGTSVLAEHDKQVKAETLREVARTMARRKDHDYLVRCAADIEQSWGD